MSALAHGYIGVIFVRRFSSLFAAAVIGSIPLVIGLTAVGTVVVPASQSTVTAAGHVSAVCPDTTLIDYCSGI
jgi:hypothetical protein